MPDERIVYAYDMWRNTARMSVSLATVEYRAQGAGTLLRITERGVFLDGYDYADGRQQGTGVLLEQLHAALRRETIGG